MMVNKKKCDRLSVEMSTYLKFLHVEGKVGIRQLWRRYGDHASLATIYRHATAQLNPVNGVEKATLGRKRVISDRDKRNLMRVFTKNRNTCSNFTSKRLLLEAGLTGVCHNRTLRRYLNHEGYFYLQSRKKGLLLESDLKKRLNFAKQLIKDGNNKLSYWTEDIAFFFDGTSFVHKTNPEDQAVAPKARVWRKKEEGLKRGCTAKGSKAGYGGQVAHFFVSISHNKGVISCEQYFDRLTGKMFMEFVNAEFRRIFSSSKNPNSTLFLQDGDPRQNSKIAQNAFSNLGIKCFAIPPRSPDLNPIENFFHLVNLELHEQAIKAKIVHETFEQFSTRVRNCMLNFPINLIDNIIESMPKRIHIIIKNKGERLKY